MWAASGCASPRCSRVTRSVLVAQVPFARYVARTGVSELKRYSIERVYRERRVRGLHPRELTECALDIVSPNSARWAACVRVCVRAHEVNSVCVRACMSE